MAGFSLGGGRGDQEPTASGAGIPHDSLFLSAAAAAAARSSDVSSYTTRGFELWHQPLYPASSGLLSFASSSTSPSGGHHEHSAAHASRARGGSSGSGGGGVSCQDCGNQAKKDCVHLRCRTCCKSRGFPCPTHVKSTWVPAAKRRERQQQLAAAAAASAQHPSEASKRPRDTNTSAAAGALVVAAPATACGGGVMEGTVSFPAEVSSAAVFRCMRVSPLDEADEEFAYQTAVSIGGHVFKGILYDRGPDHHHQPPALATGLPSPSSASAAAISSGTAGGVGPTGTSAAGMLDPSSLYPAPISAFMAGTQFFPHHPRP